MMTLSPSTSPQWELLDFNQEEQEYILFDSVVSEANDIMGFPIEYWTIESSGSDYLYGENPTQEWDGPFYTKLLYEPTSEPDVLNVFGLSSDDTIETMQLTKTVFKRDISSTPPVVGDLIKTLWNNKTYEVAEVSSEATIFQGMKMVWDLICRPFRYNYESDDVDGFLFNDPDSDDFPDINETTTTQTYTTSGDTIQYQYGDNDEIEEESDSIEGYEGLDTIYYGYGD